MTDIIPIRAFKDNYIWMLTEPHSASVWVVDPGEAQPVIDMLKQKQFTLAGILLTHHHNDHSGGIADLVNYAGDIPVYGSFKSTITHITHRVKTGDTVTCGATTFKAIEIPGHTLDHTAYYGAPILFSGDMLFSAGCGRVFEGTMQQMYSSLQTLCHLSDDTEVYCGHEYTLSNLQFAHHVEPDNRFIIDRIESTKKLLENNECTLPSLIRDEKKMNPFFRCEESAVIAAAEKHSGKKLSKPVEVFEVLREWKNNFKG